MVLAQLGPTDRASPSLWTPAPKQFRAYKPSTNHLSEFRLMLYFVYISDLILVLCPKIGTSPINWGQLNRFHLQDRIQPPRCFYIKIGQWIMSRSNVMLGNMFPIVFAASCWKYLPVQQIFNTFCTGYVLVVHKNAHKVCVC